MAAQEIRVPDIGDFTDVPVIELHVAPGDTVAVEARGDMVTKGGVPYCNEYCLVFRLVGGKIVEMREYCDSLLTETVLGPYPAR